MGTPVFALPTLRALIESDYNVRAVVTQPDRPKGRHYIVEFSEVKKLAIENNISVLQPDNIRKSPWPKNLENIGCDLIVTCAFGQILPQSILDIPKYGTINVHASLLPKYRGAAPIQRAILEGELVTGVTTMLTDIGMDTGDMLLFKETEISDLDDASSLHDRLAEMGASLLIDTIKLYEEDKIKPIAQDDSKATYAPMIKKEEGKLDFNKSAKDIFNHIRAFNPWPGTYTTYCDKVMKILEASYSDETINENLENGTVTEIYEDRMVVKCQEGSLNIKKLQFEDRKAMQLRQCGHNMACGIILGQ